MRLVATRMRRYRKLALGIGVAMLATLVVLVWHSVWYPLFPYVKLHQMPFDAGQWKAADTSDRGNPRPRMVTSLVRRHRLVGMTYREVAELLGPGGLYRPSWRSPTVFEASYALEPDWLFGIDHLYLILYFDQDGKMVRWRVGE